VLEELQRFRVAVNNFSFLSDDEKIFQGSPPDAMWEQFAQVATDLLERIQSCMSINSSPLDSFDFDHDDQQIDAVMKPRQN
jgi:hypothetical protein